MAARLGDFAVKFGTSGARGLVTDFTPAYCASFTLAFLSLFEPLPRHLLIGRDLRPSSEGIAAACAAAARHAGVAVIDAGEVPTPALAFTASRRGLPAIMVTGSHIPDDRNGLKAYRSGGEITKADEAAMLAAAFDLPSVLPAVDLSPPDASIRMAYLERYIDSAPPGLLNGRRIGVYEHSTVARDLLHDILAGLGAETVALGRSARFVPVDTEAIRAEDAALARGWAQQLRLDAIVSADGDADRPMIADEQGRWLRGDAIGLLAAMALGARSIVTPVSSNTAAERCGAFAKVIRTRIGSPHVIAGMEQAGNVPPVAGYEANGGFLLDSDVAWVEGRKPLQALPTRDAVLPILLVLGLAARRGLSVSELAASLPARATYSERLEHVATDWSLALIDNLSADRERMAALLAPHSGNLSSIDRTDGLRVTFASGDIVHLRPSGNAPELRCYTEAADAETAEALCRACLDRVRHLDPPSG